MNSESRNHLANMMHMRYAGALTVGSDADVMTDTGDAGLSGGRAAQALAMLAREGAMLSKALEEQLDAMQERFLALLNSQLTADRHPPEDRLHFSLSEEGTLVIEGNDTDTARLCDIIDRRPELQERFRELAQIALLAYGVEVARRAQSMSHNTGTRTDYALLSRYHMCHKGSLSHFFVK